MKKTFLLLVLFSQLLFYNCSDDESSIVEVKTSEVDEIAAKLQEIIDESHPSVARVFFFNVQENNWISEGGCNGYEIDKPFIKVCGIYYNLQNLVKYRLNGGLELYFKYQ